MAGVNRGEVSRVDAESHHDSPYHIVLFHVEVSVDFGKSAKEVHHVVAGGVVGVHLYLLADVVHGNIAFHYVA